MIFLTYLHKYSDLGWLIKTTVISLLKWNEFVKVKWQSLIRSILWFELIIVNNDPGSFPLSCKQNDLTFLHASGEHGEMPAVPQMSCSCPLFDSYKLALKDKEKSIEQEQNRILPPCQRDNKLSLDLTALTFRWPYITQLHCRIVLASHKEKVCKKGDTKAVLFYTQYKCQQPPVCYLKPFYVSFITAYFSDAKMSIKDSIECSSVWLRETCICILWCRPLSFFFKTAVSLSLLWCVLLFANMHCYFEKRCLHCLYSAGNRCLQSSAWWWANSSPVTSRKAADTAI